MNFDSTAADSAGPNTSVVNTENANLRKTRKAGQSAGPALTGCKISGTERSNKPTDSKNSTRLNPRSESSLKLGTGTPYTKGLAKRSPAQRRDKQGLALNASWPNPQKVDSPSPEHAEGGCGTVLPQKKPAYRYGNLHDEVLNDGVH